tara:strand:+ start:5200 stop:7152 length:1953 start_codon:yes stop_codon:yes gene_type:complete
MARRLTAPMLTVLITLVLMGVSSSPVLTSFADSPVISSTEGRQDTLDVDCSGYSFEDLFEYDFALFELNVLDDWATGDMYANAWVNGSNSAIVRDNLDGLFEGLPGGDNDWISTDERDAVRSIGPKCIADMETRLGMREGIPHSGGVDWNDFEFVEDGIGLDEVNLVPEGHPDARTCTNFGAAADCKEVPTSTTDDMEISLSVADGQNHNVRWDQLPNSGVSNFTLAMNISNMSNAALVVTFPVLQGLRMYDFRVMDNQPASGQTCDHIGEPSFIYLPDGALQVTQLVNFDRTQWDLYCDMFMDFTTQEPAMNDIPAWTGEAPANGTIVPTSGTGTWPFASADVGNGWATDENGWSLQCSFDEAGWSVSTNVLGDFFITQPADSTQATATCAPVDPLGASDENDTRTWTFGTLYTATATVDNDGKNARLTITSTGLVNEFLFSARATQNGQMGAIGETVSVASGPTVTAVSLQAIRPGAFSFAVMAEASSMLDHEAVLALGLTKPNSPPVVSVAVNFDGENATWDDSQLKFEMYGLVSDPDLEAVTMSLTICGAEYQGFNIDGINWVVEVSTAICLANGLTNYDVLITAVDESGASTQLAVSIPSPVSEEPPAVAPPLVDDESGALPSVSFLATLSMLGAALLLQRRKPE